MFSYVGKYAQIKTMQKQKNKKMEEMEMRRNLEEQKNKKMEDMKMVKNIEKQNNEKMEDMKMVKNIEKEYANRKYGIKMEKELMVKEIQNCWLKIELAENLQQNSLNMGYKLFGENNDIDLIEMFEKSCRDIEKARREIENCEEDIKSLDMALNLERAIKDLELEKLSKNSNKQDIDKKIKRIKNLIKYTLEPYGSDMENEY